MDQEEEKQLEEEPAELAVAPDLRARLATSWAGSAAAAFYGAVTTELCPRVHRALRARFRLTDDECEDCTAQVLERLLQHGGGANGLIVDPLSYIYTSSTNVAVDLLRSKAREREVVEGWIGAVGQCGGAPADPDENDAVPDHDGSDVGLDGVSADPALAIPIGWAAVVIEETLPETDVEATWAQEIVTAALARLSPVQRRVLQYLMMEDFDYAAGDLAYRSERAAAALSMTPGAFRTNKSRAYARLRDEIPKVLSELGVVLPTRVVDAISAGRPRLPSDEDDGLDDA